jgi:hypothetical protein
MLDLLAYCHIFASMRYPHEVAAVVAAADRIKMQCANLVAGVLRARRSAAHSVSACPFDTWTHQGLLCTLDRLDAYVTSMA